MSVAHLHAVQVVHGMGDLMHRDDRQVVAVQPVVELHLAARVVVPTERVAGLGFGDATDRHRVAGHEDALGHRRLAWQTAPHDAVVAQVARQRFGQQQVEPQPRARVALRELHQPGGETVRIGFFNAALLAATTDVAETDEAIEERIEQTDATQVLAQLDPMRFQVHAGQAPPIEHLVALTQFDREPIGTERDGERQPRSPVPTCGEAVLARQRPRRKIAFHRTSRQRAHCAAPRVAERTVRVGSDPSRKGAAKRLGQLGRPAAMSDFRRDK